MLKLNLSGEGQETAPESKKWLLPAIVAVFVLVLLSLGLLVMLFEIYYADKFFPGSRIGQFDFSGLTKQQAFSLVEKEISSLNSGGITVKYQEQGADKILFIDNPLTSESIKKFFEYDAYATISDNYDIGRKNGFLTNLYKQSLISSGLIKMAAVYDIDQDYIVNNIKGQIGNLETKEQDALPKIVCADSCSIEITEARDGLVFNYDEALKKWRRDLDGLQNKPIELRLIAVKPQITKSDSEKLIAGLNTMFTATSSIEFYYQDKKFNLDRAKLGQMIHFERNKDKVYFAVDKESFSAWFKENVSAKLDVEAKNAALEMKNGQIVSLSAHQEGQAADLDKAYSDLNSRIITGNFKDLRIELAVKQILPDLATSDVNDLGIKEIIGTGESSFAGSPTNRRKNIKNGASKLHGLLIKPDEEFSLIKTLLPVDAENGYFPELVIKGNKTTPEYGGGLCQVGTTMFRAALASGLPILERRNHSYSVTYYLENGLPGVDATIYDPKPDLRFKNDTGHYILIQARIEGDKLYFDFWGTKDGRVASRTKPKTWGLNVPPPTKIIETLDLKPGEKKCTESSHNGISASFNYIVAYPDGQVATSTFTSVYKPWQAVCLVGVASLSASSSTDAAVTPTE